MTQIQDVRDLIGMRSRAAYSVVALYAVTCLVSALATMEGMTSVWPPLGSVAVCVGGALILLASPGDPLRLRPSLALILVGPVSCGLVYSVMPVPASSSLQTWPLGASVAIYTFMCVRGRTLFAWVGLTLTIGSSLFWAVVTGQGIAYGLSFSGINVAPLLMATFFAFTIRPLGRSIFELRIQSTLRISSAAAASAVLEERDAQLERLDEQARPLLGRIVDGPDLNADELLACELLEADLRDSLRARGLAGSQLSQAARSARSRGVQVVMLDDRGEVPLDAPILTELTASAAAQLDSIDSGTVTVRMLPPGRSTLATILHNDSDDTHRFEYGPDGTIVEHSQV